MVDGRMTEDENLLAEWNEEMADYLYRRYR